MPARISVLVPTFNRADFLAACLDSLLSQSLPPAQVIVVNDGSTDGTTQVLQAYRHRLDYVETPQVGKPAAINAGLERVTGDYLWIFDDDDVALPEALARLVEPLERHPQHGFSYCTFFYTANCPEDNRLGPILGESVVPDLQKRGFLIPLLESNFLGGAALFARTSCYHGVGPFDPRLLRSQDYEMAIRIARRFTGLRIPGGPTFHYRQHEGLRGSLRDRFGVGARLGKWLEYDQEFFRQLLDALPLQEYLPPGGSLERQARQAHLQRLAIAASKLLLPETLRALEVVATLPDQSPLSASECEIVRRLAVHQPYYGSQRLSDHPAFLDEVRRRARSSNTIRFFRRELLRGLPGRWRTPRPRKSPGQMTCVLRSAVCLYLPAWPLRSRRPWTSAVEPQ